MVRSSGMLTFILLRPCRSSAQKPAARKRRFDQPFQRDLGCPAAPSKIFRLTCRANQFYQLAVSSRQEGRIAIVTNAGWDAVDAAASGAQMESQGRFIL